MKYQIINGNNIDVLKTFPDNHFDSIVTDPPYGIDFLGKSWDANTGALETYQECLRVLKPGGHILAFSAARTYHHLAITLEQAGFEIRDQIMWIYSSGFPKSQDVGKSIDRQSGRAAHKAELAEIKAILKQLYKNSGKTNTQIDRECGFNAGGYLKTDFKDKGWANNLPKDEKWIKLKSVLGCGDDYDDYFITTPQVKVGEKQAGCFGEGSDYTIGGRSQTVDITQSQTDAGRQWAGWGTALKPAHEPIALARKPIKLSIAKNCQTHGVGALNIDATRIPYEDQKDIETYLNNKRGPMERGNDEDGKNIKMFNGETGFKAVKREVTVEQDLPELGRFPSNVLGEIAEPYQKYFYCPKVSRRERHTGFELPPPMFGDVQGAYGPDGQRFAVGFDARAEGKKKKYDPLAHIPTDPSGKYDRTEEQQLNANERIESKGVKTYKEMIEDMGGHYLDTVGNPQDINLPSKDLWLPEDGYIKAHTLKDVYERWCKRHNKPLMKGNNHPTVKPIELMKYLIKLVTPPGGRVLDPFNGSGSTGCAAVELGHEYVGIELDPNYVEIATKRIEAWNKQDTTFTEIFE